MSISDQIVVMEKGIIRQVGKPQDVYDEPTNLFVAKFLGTPPINVFAGTVKDGKLFIGEEEVLAVAGAPDGDITVGVRPEGFMPLEDGPLTCELITVERMGRDTSVVARHSALEAVQMRAIVGSYARIDSKSPTVRFHIRPDKTRLFDKVTGERVRFEGDSIGDATSSEAAK